MTAKDKLIQAMLYGILDLGYIPDEQKALSAMKEMIAGGVDIIQLRAKGRDPKALLPLSRSLCFFCERAGVPFIINDHLELAQACDADGLHLGQDDGSLAEAKAALGQDKLVGRSTHSLQQAKQALEEGADYLGFGPLYTTPTKPGRPAIGLEDLANAQRNIGSKVPLFAIGGVNRKTLPTVLKAGAKRVVVVSDILTSSNIAQTTAEVVELIATATSL